MQNIMTFKIPCIEARWDLFYNIGDKGNVVESVRVNEVRFNATVTPDEVVKIRQVTRNDRDTAFGPREEDGMPGVHPDAQTVIETKNDRLFTEASLYELFVPQSGNASAKEVERLSATSKLALAVVASGRPEVLEVPGVQGKITDVIEPVRQWMHQKAAAGYHR